MVERVLMTSVGHKKLLDEIHMLTEERSNIVKAIERARELGDLSENADYDAAKQAQALNASRLNFLQGLCSQVVVVDAPKNFDGRVVFGVKVRLCNLSTDEEIVYTIVSAYESSIENGMLSVESPLARALLGKRVGDIARLELPKGSREYEILEVWKE